jgi:hypothetical protein
LLNQTACEINEVRLIASPFLARLVFALLAAALFCGRIGAVDQPEQNKEEEARREQSLRNMQSSAAQYTLSSSDTPKRSFKFHETAILRPSNPITGTTDGALYVWTNQGRPQALLRLFTFKNNIYSHAWLSLSESKFVAERGGKVVWSPAEPGIQLRAMPDAPEPADTPVKRLRQMKLIANKFTATYTAVHLAADPFELRFLNQPLFQYETDDEYRADGALFGYVQGTTPIGLLLLESRPTSDGHRWNYAFSTLVTGPVTARYEDKEVFSLQRDNASKNPTMPFILFRSLPVPKE